MFDWRTEDEDTWQEEAAEQPEPRRRRPWILLLLLLVLLGAGGFFLVQRLDRTVEQATEAVREDVRSSHALLQQAVERQDRELLASLLSGSDRAWVENMKTLLDEGLLVGRPALGLASGAGQGQLLEVELAPDLASATLTVGRPFLVTRADGITETVSLEQTEYYRRGSTRWLLSPPDEIFWGPTLSSSGARTTVVFPAREQEIGGRLAADMEQLLVELCQGDAAGLCPPDFRQTVIFDTRPESLMGLDDPLRFVQPGRELHLPAPTLVGLPQGEAAYEALRRAYGQRLVAAALGNMLGFRCCQGALLYRALLDAELARLRLRPWPLTPDLVEGAVRQPLLLETMLAELAVLWRRPLDLATNAPNWWHNYLFVAFLLELNPDSSPPELQQSLLDAGNYLEWASSYLLLEPEATVDASLEQRWLRFIARQNGRRLSSPLPLPEQGVRLLCGREGSPRQALYSFDLASEQLALELDGVRFDTMHPAPGDVGVLLDGLVADGLQTTDQLVYWHDGQGTVLWQSPSSVAHFFLGLPADPGQRYLPMATVQNRWAGGNSDVQFLLFDLASCLSGGCQPLPLAGWPHWSPDGRRTLLSTLDGQIYLAGVQGQEAELLVPEKVAFTAVSWLDDTTFFYSTLEPRPFGRSQGGELFRMEVGGAGPELVADRRAWQALMPAAEAALLDEPDTSLNLTTLAPSPGNADELWVAASLFNPQARHRSIHIFSYDQASRTLRRHISLGRVPLSFPDFHLSPDGRWLAMSVFGERNEASLLFYNTASGRLQEVATDFPGSDYAGIWSADGRWFLQSSTGYLRLFAPDDDYERLLPHGLARCHHVAWSSGG